MCGRTLVLVRKGYAKISKFYGWIIRMTVCLAGAAYRNPIDAIDFGIWVAAALAFGAGWWTVSHQKPPEDLTHEIFPE